MTYSIKMVLQQGFLQGYSEVLGNELLSEIVGAEFPNMMEEKKSSTLEESLEPAFFQHLDEALLLKYGKPSAKGIARSAGRLAFKGYKDALPILVEHGSIEKRLLPFSEKIGGSLQDFLHELNENALTDLQIQRNAMENNWFIDGKILQPEGAFLSIGDQQFFIGILESLLEWLDSRHQFQVEQYTPSQENPLIEIHLQISVRKLD